MDAGSLNCPECGAAVSSDSTQCRYCGALLQTVACPKCMGMMFAGSKFCPHCGVPTEQVAIGDESTKDCPRCHLNLHRVMVGQTPLEECMRCGGIWVDANSFDHICSNAEEQTAATALVMPPPVATDPTVRYLPCPQCQNLMNRVNYAQRSGIIINMCKGHGMWLDRDELREIMEFIRTGGLARAQTLNDDEEARTLAMQKLDAQMPTGFGESLGDSLGSRSCIRGNGGLALWAIGTIVKGLM